MDIVSKPNNDRHFPVLQPEAIPFGHLAVPRIRRLLHRLPVSAGKGIQSGTAGHAAARL